MAGTDRSVVVAGGGIGGLAAALALGRAGFRCTVLEQAEVIGAIGYGIQLGPNVFWALQRLGLDEAVLAKAHRPSAILALDAKDGSEIIRIPTDDGFKQRFTFPYVVIHRADLHEILIDACRNQPLVELRAGVAAESVVQADDHVEVASSGGRVRADLFIAADGLNSRFRALVAPADDDPQPTGFVAHRSIVPRSVLPSRLFRDEVILWAGDGYHIVAYPLRDGTLYNIVAVFRTASAAERKDADGYRQELRETYRDAHPDMLVLLDHLNTDRRWPIADRKLLRRLVANRVALLGDAAHATLQSLAQGAGMSIEDGVCIANCLAADGPTPAALHRYEALRRTRTARVQLESRLLWEVYHCGGVAADVRRETFVNRTPAQYYECLAWLYDNPEKTLAGEEMQKSAEHPVFAR